MTEAFDHALLGKGLGARLADIEAAMARLGSFAFVPDEPVPARDEADIADAARELVLRAFAIMSDTVNFRLLRALGDGDAPLADLVTATGLSAVGVWERVGDLVQVGLVARTLDGDRAGLTAAGQALLILVEQLAEAAAEGSRS